MTTRETVKTTVQDIFHKIAPDIEFAGLDLARPLREQVELDSMDFYNVLVQVHKRLGVNVPDSVLMETDNLDGLIDYITSQASDKT